MLVNWFPERTTAEAVQTLSDAGVPVAPVNDIPRAAQDPHLREREVMVEVSDQAAGTIHVTGRVIKFSRSGMPVGSAPEIGEHSEEILHGVLGLSATEIEALRAGGVT